MSRCARLAAVFTAGLVFGCAGSSGSAPLAGPSPAAKPVASAAPVASATIVAPASAKDVEAERAVARALKYVSALRELDALGPVNGRIVPRDEMVQRIEHSLDTEIPPAVVTASGEILFALGTVPASYDYRRGLLEMMRSELLGFYEPREKTMFLGGDLHGKELDATLWHELVHALQDQHYGLGKLLTWSDDAGDWQAALHGLAEGDATSAMIDALFAEQGMHAPDLPDSVMDLQGALSAGTVLQVPPIVKRSVVAPYIDGLSFVNAMRRRGGWDAVAAAWRRMPKSTEQLLHLDKYDAQEAPESLPALAPSPSGPSRLVYSDVYGEETLRVLFEEWMPARAARDAASGWAGDRVSAFSDGAVTSVAWHIRYDTDAAALTALHAFARGALAPEDQPVDDRGRLSEFVSASEAEQATRAGQVCRERHTRGPFAVLRQRRDLVVTLGPYRRSAAGAQAETDCKAALSWAAALMTQPKTRF